MSKRFVNRQFLAGCCSFLVLSCHNPTSTGVDHSLTNNHDVPAKIDSTVSVILTEGFGIETGELWLSWSSIDSAVEYQLEEAMDESFAAPNVIYQGPVVSIQLAQHNDSSIRYYRARAVFHDCISRWSNTFAIPSSHTAS